MRSGLIAALVLPLALCAQNPTRNRGTRQANTNPIDHTGAYNEPAATFSGPLKRITGKLIVITGENDEAIEIRRTHKTKFLKDGKGIKPEEIAPGTLLRVDVGKDPDLNPQAINVVVDDQGERPPAPTQN